MKSKEKILHYVGAKFILGESVSFKLNGEEAQLAVFSDLLQVSKSLKECLDNTDNIDTITQLIDKKRQLTKEFQSLTGIVWRL